MILPPWIYAAAGGGVLLAGFLGGWTVRDWKADSDDLKVERKSQEQFVADAQALADLSLRYEQTAQALRDAERDDRERIREVFRNVQVPANCAAPADVVSVLDNAVSRANAAASGQSGGTVPKAP